MVTSVEGLLSDEVHAIIPPCITALFKARIEAVSACSTIPILVRGGTIDSIFTESCVNWKCFGSLSVAFDQDSDGGWSEHWGWDSHEQQRFQGKGDSIHRGDGRCLLDGQHHPRGLPNQSCAQATPTRSAPPSPTFPKWSSSLATLAMLRLLAGACRHWSTCPMRSSPSKYEDASKMNFVIVPEQWDERGMRRIRSLAGPWRLVARPSARKQLTTQPPLAVCRSP
ncbi:unnamed protein product [Prorocentrum cordatum]|uniref:Uncharacterized protein n=1 Tax=Prorocentrum cordatum TaxID=2364126 RepID=A0ABN9S5B7_9DINO|nr:unnamed protein product [Polarella glacialis]